MRHSGGRVAPCRPVVGEKWGTRQGLSCHLLPVAETLVKTHIPAKDPQIYHSTIEINSAKVSGRSARFVILRIGERLGPLLHGGTSA